MKAYCLKTVDPDKLEWEHPIAGSTLYIEKDGMSIQFSSDEIIDMLKALQFISSDSLDCYKLDNMKYQ